MNLTYILFNFPKIASNIAGFLSYNSLADLSLASHSIHQSTQSLIIERIKLNYLSFSSNLLKKKPKAKNSQKSFKIITTPNSLIVKMSVFEFPREFFCKSFWKSLEISTKELQLLLKEEKFVKETNNLFFINANNQIMFMNRSLLDESLAICDEKADKTSEFTEESKYEKLYTDNEITKDLYDFSSMQSMLHRQKKVMASFENKSKISTALSQQILEKSFENLKRIQRICVILCHGGNFSIGIFDKSGNCVLHKSDHKYVTRKKAGQRQAGKDKHAGTSIKSMGSQIRRENEKIHQMNVDNILEENLKEIEQCDLVFLQAPGVNKLLLIEENKPLFKIREKLRSLCLTAKKANYTEVERIFKAICKVYLILE